MPPGCPCERAFLALIGRGAGCCPECPNVAAYSLDGDLQDYFLAALNDRTAGLIARARGNSRAAQQLLDFAAVTLDDLRTGALAAYVRLEWAEGGDPADACVRSAVLHSLLTLERCGVSAAAEQARQLAESIGVPVPARQPLAPLSPRESEVAHLVSCGYTNVQIAHRLHISERTVESHVRNTYARLGITSRAALATWIADQ